jgi:hypothetical protein
MNFIVEVAASELVRRLELESANWKVETCFLISALVERWRSKADSQQNYMYGFMYKYSPAQPYFMRSAREKNFNNKKYKQTSILYSSLGAAPTTTRTHRIEIQIVNSRVGRRLMIHCVASTLLDTDNPLLCDSVGNQQIITRWIYYKEEMCRKTGTF